MVRRQPTEYSALARLRMKAKLTQKQAATKLGIPYQRISELECGLNRNPTLETLVRLAQVYRAPVQKIIKAIMQEATHAEGQDRSQS